MRVFALVALAGAVGCGGATGGFDLPADELPAAHDDALEFRGEHEPEAAATEADVPCVQIDGAVERRWANAEAAFNDAAARWGLALPRGSDCQLVLMADQTTLWSEVRAFDVSGRAKIGILVNPKDSIVDGPECDAQIRLADALTHELGHVAGLPHPAPGVCEHTRFAMCPQQRCEETMPTGEELDAIRTAD